MATLTFSGFSFFDDSTGAWISNTSFTSTLTDNEPDNAFQVGDTANTSADPAVFTYQGTASNGSDTLPIFTSANIPDTYVAFLGEDVTAAETGLQLPIAPVAFDPTVEIVPDAFEIAFFAVGSVSGADITFATAATPMSLEAVFQNDDGVATVGETVTIEGGGDYTFVGSIEAGGVTGFVIVDFSGSHIAVFTEEPPDLTGATYSLVQTATPVCFAAGTDIATPTGPVPVEDLTPGMTIRTADGGTTPVLWVGRQTVLTRFGPADRLRLVRLRAGALGPGLPLRDLVLTADHALLIDGILVNAGALVNGSSIDFVPRAELGQSYIVYHIETEGHEVILAEGCPAETYIDYVARRAFDNYAEYVALCGADRAIPEMASARISSARHLPPALAARLGITRAA